MSDEVVANVAEEPLNSTPADEEAVVPIPPDASDVASEEFVECLDPEGALADDEASSDGSTLDVPAEAELVLRVSWGSLGCNGETCRIGWSLHEDALPLERVKHHFNKRRLAVIITTADFRQKQLPGMETPTVTLRGTADTKSFSVNGDHYTGGLTFQLKEIDVSVMTQLANKAGSLVVSDTSNIPSKRKAKDVHPDLQTGGDRPHGTGHALAAVAQMMSPEFNNTLIANLKKPGTSKPAVSAAVADALAAQGIRTCEHLQSLMTSKPEHWRHQLIKETKGLAEAGMERLIEAFQIRGAECNVSESTRKLCHDCGSLYENEAKCPSCSCEFFDAVNDETVNSQGAWELEHCDRTIVCEVGNIKCETLLKQDEFKNWHFGCLITVAKDGDESALYGANPEIIGNAYDEKLATTKSHQMLLEELQLCAVDYPGDIVEECVSNVQEGLDKLSE